MTGYIIGFAALLLFVIFLLLPVGGGLEYSEDGLEAWAKVGPKRIAILPARERKSGKKPKKSKREKTEKKEKPEKKRGGDFGTLKELISLALKGASNLKRGIRVEHMTLRFTVKSEGDPAGAAIAYGRAWAAIGIIVPVLDNNFIIKKREISGEVGFQGEGFNVFLSAEVTIRIYKVFAIAFGVLFGLLKLWIAKKRKKQRTASVKKGVN